VAPRGAESLSTAGRQKWAASRLWAAHQAPYLARALLALDAVVVDSDGGSTPEIDLSAFPVDVGWHVYVDPTVLDEMPTETVGFWLIHQASHLLRHHHDRFPTTAVEAPQVAPTARRGPEQVRWNVAGDLEINDDLVAGQVVLPDRAELPRRHGFTDGLTAETYFDMLPKRTTDTPTDRVHDETDGPTPGRDPGESTDCGGGCDGQPRPWDTGGSGLSAMGRQLLEHQVAHEIRERQRSRGDVPAGWGRWADDVLEPVIDWRRALAAAVRRGLADVTGRVDFTYRKPSRRSASSPDVVMPSLRQPVPQVAMVLDTSGSMSDTLLSQCLAEVGGVLAGLGVARHQLRIVCCDAEAYEAQRVMAAREVKLLGGGGTDMGAGLREAADLRPRPDLVVVLTDGYTPWPASAPRGIEVVVGLIGGGGGTAPPWARAVSIEPRP
jgi:predicted metal-dependent peptidase